MQNWKYFLTCLMKTRYFRGEGDNECFIGPKHSHGKAVGKLCTMLHLTLYVCVYVFVRWCV